MLNIRELRDRALIRPVKRAVEDQLLDLPGVVAVDIGDKHVDMCSTGEQAIVVSVRRKERDERLATGARVPSSVLGIPTDVIEEQPVLQHEHRPLRQVPIGCRPGEQAPTRGGHGIAPCRPIVLGDRAASDDGRYRRVGTLGALVVGRARDPVMMGLTTFDVACMDDAWAVGDRMADPDTGRVYAGLARAALSGRVNVAAVAIHSGVECFRGISGLGPITGQCAAHPGETVHKSGRGTGVTTGTVVSTDTTVRVDHGDALGVRVLREQVRVCESSHGSPFTGNGDAGAVLVNSDGCVVGLCFGGSRDGTVGFACPIADVLTELDVDLRADPHRRGNVR
ncbi:hypothetical protein DFQ14_101259 [Halopolyspora algeriensis]|uniref:Uncharacterized protein n=1 Tax=Halopolyspora algeriensis TaxID=1500506 RepID=A0A368VZQ6_9ACTN|nr:hypothetical protein [Halopolyspora algeriensis]RCW46919.1 hypothetical protein DFQ14_101259 [Halopolyspora algeriensis]TQM48010.1 hypothetical protein FHU43_2962 [Halopolyspora algeriensis]